MNIQREICLVIDDSVLLEYEQYYFQMHPKARLKPFLKPYHESINEWMIMRRPQMNALKQKWKDFICWFVKRCGYENLHIEKCSIVQKIYFQRNNRHDIDNTVPKFILDGLVESGMIVDDDYKHITSLTMECGVDNLRPRTQITIVY